MTLGAVVLAGGASRRFGADKLAFVVDGEPLLVRALRAVAEVADEVVVVVAPGSPEPGVPPGLPARLHVARDAAPREGPLAGLLAGLDALAGLPDQPDVAIVVAGDMPWLAPAVLRRLVAALAGIPGPAAIVPAADRRVMFPMAVRVAPAREAAARLLAGGRRRVGDLLRELDAPRLPEAEWRPLDPAGLTLEDVDRPEDLSRPRLPRPRDAKTPVPRRKDGRLD